MASLKYNPTQLPGELFYRRFLNEKEVNYQLEYYNYQSWRIKIGIPMDDVDVIVSDDQWESFQQMRNMEYERINGKVINYAVLEMKHYRVKDDVIARILTSSTSNGELANSANLPFFVVKYFPEQECGQWEFSVYSANDIAKNIIPTSCHMSEKQFVKFLYEKLRGKDVPAQILEHASAKKNSFTNYQPL